MADSLEKENLTTWLRRPSIFVANAWYLLAANGRNPYALDRAPAKPPV